MPQTASYRYRYGAMAAVLALHVAVVAGILVISRFRHVSASPNTLEILFLPPQSKGHVPTPPEFRRPSSVRDAPSSVSTSPAPTPASPAVDWTGEAQTVAASKAREDSLTTATGSDVAPA
jgi:hypothetical protein